LFGAALGATLRTLTTNGNSDSADLTVHDDPVPATEEGARALPELLAPAGDWECARAAVENGADAIYFGLEKFNARMRAHNFTESDLPELMEFLHRRGVKGYVTFNTLVFENELAEAAQYARTIIRAGVDAAIVQDAGICRLIRGISPDFPVHASTQMTVTSLRGVQFARELGCNLVVLARECTIKEIEQIRFPKEAEDGQQASVSLPLEVFVHGALCVAYSGQCLTSESLGGRSANRGECAQACRMPYELICDGQPVSLGDRKYLLSPQDLAGLEILPQLVRLGIASLKIEGRLKAPEYVANITRIYRKALNSLQWHAATRPGEDEPGGNLAVAPEDRYAMDMAFSRGLYTGWFGGINNQALVHARFGKKRGAYLGEVAGVHHDGVTLHLQGALKPGDGVVFDAGRPEEKEEGGRVYEVRKAGMRERGSSGSTLSFVGFGRGDIDFSRVRVGNKLWKTSDPELERHLHQTFAGGTPRYQRAIDFEVHGNQGKPLTVIARDGLGHSALVDSLMPLAPAEKQPLTTERLQDQLGRLGGTPFRLGRLVNHLQGSVMAPLSELNRLRREVVAELERLRARPLRWQMLAESSSGLIASIRSETLERSDSWAAPHSGAGEASRTLSATPQGAELVVLVRNMSQLQAAIDQGIGRVYCEFEDPKKYRDAVLTVKAWRKNSDRTSTEIFVAPPRIFKMGEEWTLNQVRSSQADGYLVRNYDHLVCFEEERKVGDYSLNISNHLSAEYFKNRFGLERLTASYDLNFGQLEALLWGAPPDWFEITIHQHMPMFHMEHCVFCAFLSAGTDFRDCGRPCDRHDVRLRDRVGAEHPVKADAGCRNTVFNSLAQTGADYVQQLQALGVRHFRVEFLNESPDQVAMTIGKYHQLLRGEITGAQVWRELRLFNQLGVTRGQMAGQRP